MLTLTGNTDIDNIILLSLDLKDVQHLCSSNKYYHQLCNNNIQLQRKINNAKERVSKMIHLDREQYTFMINEYSEGGPIYDIIRYLNITEFHNQFLENEYYIMSDLNIMRKNDNYLLYIEVEDKNEYAFNMTKHELKLFLTHLFYNNLLLTY